MAYLNENVTYIGKTGTKYSFRLFTHETVFSEKSGGVYLFGKRTDNPTGGGLITKLYFGKAKIFNERLDNHEKWDAAKKLGCNCIGIHATGSESISLTVEEDILKNNDTPLNTHHNS